MHVFSSVRIDLLDAEILTCLLALDMKSADGSSSMLTLSCVDRKVGLLRFVQTESSTHRQGSIAPVDDTCNFRTVPAYFEEHYSEIVHRFKLM